MFIRFVVGTPSEDHRSLTGVIAEARFLLERGHLDRDEAARLEGAYDWFNDKLPCPPYSSSPWLRYSVAWFRDDATEAIQKMWDIVSLLREHDVPVRMLRSANPGKILYEDTCQVLVEEWKQL